MISYLDDLHYEILLQITNFLPFFNAQRATTAISNCLSQKEVILSGIITYRLTTSIELNLQPFTRL